MKIIILGAGQVGKTLAENLSDEHDVTVIDIKSDKLMALQERLDIRTLEGIASHPKVLEEAGADDADMLIAVTSSDECNIVACQIANCLFQTPTKIARVRDRGLTNYPQLFAVGGISVDMIINPAQLVTQRLKSLVENPGTQLVTEFADGKIQVASVKAKPASNLIGRTILEIYQDLSDTQAKIIAIRRSSEITIPRNDTQIEAYDELLFCSASSDTKKVTQILLNREQKFRRIMIAGGGNIGVSLAQSLEANYNVKLIEHSTSQSEIAAELLNNSVVLVGDASDADLLMSENIDEVDLFCSITNDDEVNIMSAIMAKRLGAQNTIALVNRQTYAHFLIERSPDIDIAVSPQRITGGQIIRHLRKGDMVNVHALARGNAEVIEIIAHGDVSDKKLIGIPLSDIRLPTGAMICAIQQGDKVYMADPRLTIQDGDHVVLFVIDKKSISDVEKLFQVAPSYL